MQLAGYRRRFLQSCMSESGRPVREQWEEAKSGRTDKATTSRTSSVRADRPQAEEEFQRKARQAKNLESG